MRVLTTERRQVIQRTIDKTVHVFVVYAHDPEHPRKWQHPADAHKWVRVHLQRVGLRWSYAKIERMYGIPTRSAKRYEAEGRGTKALRDAVERKHLLRMDVVKEIVGLNELA